MQDAGLRIKQISEYPMSTCIILVRNPKLCMWRGSAALKDRGILKDIFCRMEKSEGRQKRVSGSSSVAKRTEKRKHGRMKKNDAGLQILDGG